MSCGWGGLQVQAPPPPRSSSSSNSSFEPHQRQAASATVATQSCLAMALAVARKRRAVSPACQAGPYAQPAAAASPAAAEAPAGPALEPLPQQPTPAALYPLTDAAAAACCAAASSGASAAAAAAVTVVRLASATPCHVVVLGDVAFVDGPLEHSLLFQRCGLPGLIPCTRGCCTATCMAIMRAVPRCCTTWRSCPAAAAANVSLRNAARMAGFCAVAKYGKCG